LAAKLDVVISMLNDVLKKEIQMSAQLDTLTTQVKANTDAEASAVVLLQGLSAQIAAIKTDPVALQTLSDELKASADALAAAVVANTPAA
jgi:cell division septum initiation protein DivIVA